MEQDQSMSVLLLTVDQTAALCQVSKAQVYRWIRQPGFPVIYSPHQVRIHARLLDEWLVSRTSNGVREKEPAA